MKAGCERRDLLGVDMFVWKADWVGGMCHATVITTWRLWYLNCVQWLHENIVQPSEVKIVCATAFPVSVACAIASRCLAVYAYTHCIYVYIPDVIYMY